MAEYDETYNFSKTLHLQITKLGIMSFGINNIIYIKHQTAIVRSGDYI